MGKCVSCICILLFYFAPVLIIFSYCIAFVGKLVFCRLCNGLVDVSLISHRKVESLARFTLFSSMQLRTETVFLHLYFYFLHLFWSCLVTFFLYFFGKMVFAVSAMDLYMFLTVNQSSKSLVFARFTLSSPGNCEKNKCLLYMYFIFSRM